MPITSMCPINNAGIYQDRGFNVLTVSRELLTRRSRRTPLARWRSRGVPAVPAPVGLGRVINVSSGYGQLDGLSPDVPSYCLSKLR